MFYFRVCHHKWLRSAASNLRQTSWNIISRGSHERDELYYWNRFKEFVKIKVNQLVAGLFLFLL